MNLKEYFKQEREEWMARYEERLCEDLSDLVEERKKKNDGSWIYLNILNKKIQARREGDIK